MVTLINPVANPETPKFGLVLSGGGIKFATHAGAFQEMARWVGTDGKPWLGNFRALVGTSAGSLYGACYAAGYSPGHVVMLATIISELGRELFDLNGEGIAASFLEHNLAYFRGGIRGFTLLCLLETLFSRKVRERLLNYDPQNIGEKEKQAIVSMIQKDIDRRKSTNRDADYYKEQLNFGDVYRGGEGIELYLIGVNAFTGQKTVFCHLNPDEGEWTEEDDRMYEYAKPNYLNPDAMIRDMVQARENDLKAIDPGAKLNFRRFENRVYRQFDPDLYGHQFPLALAVRTSISVPVLFAPPAMSRRPDQGSPKTNAQDVFLDGGVDDNFSLSVASDPNLANCSHIFGIFLGNLGYRLPDPNSLDSAATILMKATDFLGDSILDGQRFNKHLLERHITVISAVSKKSGGVTDTQLVPDLIKEGGEIARGFFRLVQGDEPAGSENVIDSKHVFKSEPGEYIYLSDAAIAGADNLNTMKSLDPWLPVPKLGDVFSRLLELAGIGERHPAPMWKWVYFVQFFMWLGMFAFLGDAIRLGVRLFGSKIGPTIDVGGFQIDWRIIELVEALVSILLVRIAAFFIASRPRRKGLVV